MFNGERLLVSVFFLASIFGGAVIVLGCIRRTFTGLRSSIFGDIVIIFSGIRWTFSFFRGRGNYIQLYPKNFFQCKGRPFSGMTPRKLSTCASCWIVAMPIFVGVKRGSLKYICPFSGTNGFSQPGLALFQVRYHVYSQLTPGAFSRLDLSNITPLKTEVRSFRMFIPG